ncbi:MAG: membrane dipeptidase [Planctomycetota bacterium]
MVHRPIFDGHLDLAYLAEVGRDMHAEPDDCRGTLLPAAVTLPSLKSANVRGCLATIYTAPEDTNGDPGSHLGPSGHAYPAGDADAAHRCGLRQLKLYEAWRDAGVVSFLDDDRDAPLRIGVLMEGADPIRTPDEVAWWAERGVVAIGMTWARGTRYAGGNASGGGLTDAGRDLVRAIDEAGLWHDASHLSNASLDELLERSTGRIFASHSNARALLDDNERHLTDDAIRAIAGRGGIIGVNLYAGFLDPAFRSGHTRPPLARAADHADHLASIAGRDRVALGTDLDGGFDASCLPEGVEHPSDVHTLFGLLADRGWSEAQLAGFAGGNWAALLGVAWPPA